MQRVKAEEERYKKAEDQIILLKAELEGKKDLIKAQWGAWDEMMAKTDRFSEEHAAQHEKTVREAWAKTNLAFDLVDKEQAMHKKKDEIIDNYLDYVTEMHQQSKGWGEKAVREFSALYCALYDEPCMLRDPSKPHNCE